MELSKLIKRLGKICIWTSVCLLVALILLYVVRIPLSIALLESGSKEQGLTVDCLDWHLTLSPSVHVNEICLSSDNIKLTANDISWPFLDRSLDIQRISVTHTPLIKTEQDDKPPFRLDDFTLPANLPLIQVDSLIINSYLLDKPFTLSIRQESATSVLLVGDIEAKISLIEGDSGNALQAEIDWIPNKIFTAIPQLKASMTEFTPYLGLQDWQNEPIKSKFEFEANTLTSSHQLTIAERLLFEDCNLDVSFAGTIATQTATDTLITQIDLSKIPISFGIADCAKLAIVNQDLAINALTLLIENPLEITTDKITLAKLSVETPSSPAKFSLLLQNAEFLFDDDKPSKGQYLAQFDMPYHSALGDADIKAVITGEFNAQAQDIFISLNTDGFELNNLSINGETSAKTSKVLGSAKAQFQSGVFSASGKLISEEVQIFTPASAPNSQPTIRIKSLASEYQVEESKVAEITLVLTNKITKISYESASIAQINNHTRATLSHLSELDITASSEIKKPQMADISLTSIAFDHKVHATFNQDSNDFTSQGTHNFSIDSGVFGSLQHAVSNEGKVLTIQLPEQSVLSLQSQLTKINRDTTLKSGQFSGSMQYDIAANQGSGALSLNALNIDYAEYKIRGANMDERFTLNSAELQLPEAKVFIDSVDVGVPINNITVVIATKQNTFKLLQATGSIFAGQFRLDEFWLDGRDQAIKISAVDLSLAELAALQKQSGIEVTGEIGGNLPLLITAGEFKIDKGKLASQHPGTLKIKDNPAFDSIKKSQQQLALLENLNYEKLETNVSLTPDGWLKLDFSILGKNPDKNQAVNFNYGHEENIFTLLKALRITNSVQQGIEKKIEDKYSDKNNPNKGNQ